jgi:hypothetical protein
VLQTTAVSPNLHSTSTYSCGNKKAQGMCSTAWVCFLCTRTFAQYRDGHWFLLRSERFMNFDALPPLPTAF